MVYINLFISCSHLRIRRFHVKIGLPGCSWKMDYQVMLGPHFCMIGCNGLSFAPLEEPGYPVPLTPLASSLRILLAWSLEALWGDGLFSLVMLLQNILFTSNSSKIHSILPFWHFTTLAAMNPQLIYLLKWRGGNEFIRIKKYIRKKPHFALNYSLK